MAFTSNEYLIDKFTGEREYLNASATTVPNIYQAVGGDLHRVDRWNKLRSSIGTHRLRWRPCVGCSPLSLPTRRRRIVHRYRAECAPHPFEGARVGIEHKDSFVAVSVRNEQFVRLGVDKYVGRLPEVLDVRVGFLLTAFTNLHHEFPSLRELQDLIIVAVTTDPDKAFWIDVNSMLRLRPFIARPTAAPTLDEVAFGIEFQHRRCGLRLLFRT